MLKKISGTKFGTKSLKKGVMKGDMEEDMVNYPMFFFLLSTWFFVLSK